MGPQVRAEGWESRLAAHLDAARGRPFAWGEHDCALWAARWVRTATGKDYLADWEGEYDDEAGAKRLMESRGYRSPADIASAHLPEIPVPLAGRGDLLLHPAAPILGICGGPNGFFVTDAGLTAVPTLACARAWRV